MASFVWEVGIHTNSSNILFFQLLLDCVALVIYCHVYSKNMSDTWEFNWIQWEVNRIQTSAEPPKSERKGVWISGVQTSPFRHSGLKPNCILNLTNLDRFGYLGVINFLILNGYYIRFSAFGFWTDSAFSFQTLSEYRMGMELRAFVQKPN